ncbi:MAG: hydroxyethylthiazole kinase [Rickettsiales bacterium]|nr:hydroxyethylthiazole kinase [Rickettsiales bacterium]
MTTKKPLIHFLTNYVTVRDCANICLFAGASPIMADEESEVVEITKLAKVLVVNIGTINVRTAKAMLLAAKTANEIGIPVVLDPCGVGVSKFRNYFIKEFLGSVKVSVIRANASEVAAILGETQTSNGVDSNLQASSDYKIDLAMKCAKRHQCVCYMSGEYDVISDGTDVFSQKGAGKFLTNITGAGCMLTAVVGSFCASSTDYFNTTISACKWYKRNIKKFLRKR